MNPSHLSKPSRCFLLPVAAVGLVLAGPARVWGQCTQGITAITLNQGSIIAQASGPQGVAGGTVTLNCPATWNHYILYVNRYMEGAYQGSQEMNGVGKTVFNFGIVWDLSVPAPETLTVNANLSPTGIWTGDVELTVLPNAPPASPANLGKCTQCRQQGGAPM